MTSVTDALRDRIVQLESSVIELKILSTATTLNTEAIKELNTTVATLEKSMNFVKSAKTVFHMLLLSLILGAGQAIWGFMKSDDGMSPEDVAAIVKAVTETQAP